jgi:outer membrane murein-binding lipoprotein Lpp
MPRTETTIGWKLLASTGLIFAGCRATVGPQDGAVAQAARVSSLESQVAILEVRLADTRAALDAARETRQDWPIVESALLPRPDHVVDASGSAIRPAGDPGGVSRLQWRVRTEDVRDRFVQTTGPARIAAVSMDTDGRAIEVGHWTLDVDQWRDALREGLLGTAYAIDLDLETPIADSAQFLLVRLELDDVRLSNPLLLESPIPVIRPLTSRGEP